MIKKTTTNKHGGAVNRSLRFNDLKNYETNEKNKDWM